ncbi:hypothetical protein [Neorhizobium sp. P12A]|nr:hypothetical protein [Neorhizobium sp. P12A]
MLKIASSIAIIAVAAAIFTPGAVKMTYRAWRYGHLAPLFERGGE